MINDPQKSMPSSPMTGSGLAPRTLQTQPQTPQDQQMPDDGGYVIPARPSVLEAESMHTTRPLMQLLRPRQLPTTNGLRRL